ncbi:hypothetical protein SAMN02745724_01447 [Pseudoalteromonas denitrificans DSM 6059]|jgi:hypothetical protein|uniref:Uncharacterized protein n=1 Tax=Pseudoalteromonas denitrificans DSM 6059 TaxID=1123010 RepID=A0A1I1IFE4_9GAMM|nr:hypothetical protein SAMN02745724_01447 [Pseudoalteromonas denitrificans DSM 6059]
MGSNNDIEARLTGFAVKMYFDRANFRLRRNVNNALNIIYALFIKLIFSYSVQIINIKITAQMNVFIFLCMY